MAEGTVPDDMDPAQPVVKAHYVLPSGRESFSVVAITPAPDGCPTLPFVALGESVFLRDVNGELIGMQFVHRIEGMPVWQPVTEGEDDGSSR